MRKVAIIGGGPVGITLGLFLQKFNLSFQIYEKDESVSSHPKAHYVNSRSMEIFWELPHLHGSLLEAAEPIGLFRKYRYQRRLFDKLGVYNVTDHLKGEKAWEEWIGLHCHKLPMHMPQNRLSRILLDHLPKGSVQFSSKLISVEPEEGTFQFYDKSGKKKKEKADVVVLAEGFRSKTRESLGIQMKGQKSRPFWDRKEWEQTFRSF